MGQIDSAAFEFGVKAIEVHEADDGTLYIEGYASDFQTDRDAEAFEPGAFERGLKAYQTNPVLLYHHDPGKQLGIVPELALDQKGLRIKAAIPQPPAGSGWPEHVYDLVKRGMMRGFSVGGAFKRHLTPQGPRIFDVDLQEISVTPLPVNPRTLFAVAGKAFEVESDLAPYEHMIRDLETVLNTLDRSR